MRTSWAWGCRRLGGRCRRRFGRWRCCREWTSPWSSTRKEHEDHELIWFLSSSDMNGSRVLECIRRNRGLAIYTKAHTASSRIATSSFLGQDCLKRSLNSYLAQQTQPPNKSLSAGSTWGRDACQLFGPYSFYKSPASWKTFLPCEGGGSRGSPAITPQSPSPNPKK